MDHLRGVVERITYQNTENGYAVLKLAVKGQQELVTAVGAMPETHVGSVLSLSGSWRTDARYGRQFSVEKYEETLPATAYGMEKYLGSGLVKGVGPKFAQRIVQKFGEQTLDIIETEPKRLLEVPGIGKLRVQRIAKSWEEQKEIKNIMLFLQSSDVSTAHAARIYKTYGSESIQVVKDNPYRLADDIWGIGFKTADGIARKMGIGKERFVRLRSGLLYTLNKLAESGHCFATREQLISTGLKLLELEEDGAGSGQGKAKRGTEEEAHAGIPGDALLSQTLDEMIRVKEVIREDDAIYLPPFYAAEIGTANRIAALLSAKKAAENAGKERSEKERAEKTSENMTGSGSVRYDDVQLDAIRTALSSKIMILTGGPGTGKTTTTLGIINTFEASGCRVLLAAPTGRAAKRMSEATGHEAKTIHRLLEYKPPEGYQKNEEHPLEGDVLILDECSMIDLMLMFNLLKALPRQMTLILVGDTDQLPSVGAGNVLRDLIDSDRIPVVRLTRIFRQAQGSRIIMNAHCINEGKPIDLRGGKASDFFFAPAETNEATAEMVVRYCANNLPRYYHADAFRDIQVLTPMQRGICGAVNLNKLLQEAMNPQGVSLSRGGTQYRLHDKVMQIRNNYDKEVFNGDIGQIMAVDPEERELTVRFDEHDVKYDVTELDELMLAYATTIHKAQGSEYPIVVMPFTMSHYVMLQRNLLYTGVTRAKKILVLVGEKRAIDYAIRNTEMTKRNTRLDRRIRDAVPEGTERGAEAEETERRGGEEERPAHCTEAAGRPQHGAGRERETESQNRKTKYLKLKGAPQPAMMKETPSAYYGADIFARLAQSKFRSGFSLKSNDRVYVQEKGMDTIRKHAEDFIRARLAPAQPPNDGKQTPLRGHPVFLAQHATATCCRGCLEKWHHIPKGKALTAAQQTYVVNLIMEWIRRQMQLG